MAPKKPKGQTAGKKLKAQKANKKLASQKANKILKSQATGKKLKSKTTDKKIKSQRIDKNVKSQATDKSKAPAAEKKTKVRTTDKKSKIQKADKNSKTQRKRKASETPNLEVQEPNIKKPKIFLRLQFDKLRIKPSERAREIIAAIYWDINDICTTQGMMWQRNDKDLVPFYESQCNEAQNLIRMAVDFRINALSPAEKEVREVRNIARFVRNLGWRTLSICAWAEGFRRACLQETDPAVWNKLITLIRKNSESLAYFARTRNLDWRGLLLPYSNHPIPEIKQNLRWVYKWIGKEHPHHFVRTSSGGLRKPFYQHRLQEHIDECIFDPELWVEDGKEFEDPSLREEKHGDCDLCGSSERCKCWPGRLVGGLVELVDYPSRGVGVRALTNFKKGEMLAEFVGEIKPPEDDDPIYGLYLQTDADGELVRALISPQFKGNWTRFINHSCDASTDFEFRTIGNRVLMTVEATRDIPIFEELTVNYGEYYWRVPGRRCQCGEPNCISRPKSTNDREGSERDDES